jgi:hypothetical protein
MSEVERRSRNHGLRAGLTSPGAARGNAREGRSGARQGCSGRTFDAR